jgi:RNA polymerase sigma-70 factor (ECF subfamily)
MVYAVTEGKVGEAREAPARARPASRGDRPVDRNTSAPREHHLCPSALAEQMGRLVASLPEGQRELLILRAINGLSAEETADVIGSTPAAVRVAQHRALTWLRVATMHRPGV